MMERLSFTSALLIVVLAAGSTLLVANSSSGYCVYITGPTFISVDPNTCSSKTWTAHANLYTSIWSWIGPGGGHGRYFDATFCNLFPPSRTETQNYTISVFAQTLPGGFSDTDSLSVTVERLAD